MTNKPKRGGAGRNQGRKPLSETEPDDFALDAVNSAADAIRMRHATQAQK